MQQECLPVFRRGTGFGNRLFSWARAEIYCLRHNLKPVSPVWCSPRIRPLLKGGVDYNAYLRQIILFGLFKNHPDERSALHGLWLRRWRASIAEPTNLSNPPVTPLDHKGYLRFDSVGGDFHRFDQLLDDHGWLFQRLKSITRDRWLKIYEENHAIASRCIGVNIRRGKDFRDAAQPSDFITQGGLRTPLYWFTTCIRSIRERAGKDVPVLLVSDGTLEDLKPITDCGNVHFVRPGCAISDLLLLSSTKSLIGSGGSSFSAWASFFGRMPTIAHPGQCFSWFGLPTFPNGWVGTLDPSLAHTELIERMAAPFHDS